MTDMDNTSIRKKLILQLLQKIIERNDLDEKTRNQVISYLLEISNDSLGMENDAWCDNFFNDFLRKTFYDIEVGKLDISKLNLKNVNDIHFWKWLTDNEKDVFKDWLSKANKYCFERPENFSITNNECEDEVSIYGKKYKYTCYFNTKTSLYLVIHGTQEIEYLTIIIKILKQICLLNEMHPPKDKFARSRSNSSSKEIISYLKDFDEAENVELKKVEKIFGIESIDILAKALHGIYKELIIYTHKLSEYPLSISFLINNKSRTDRPGYQWFLLPHQRFFLKYIIKEYGKEVAVNSSDLDNLDKFVFVGSEDANLADCSGYCWHTHKRGRELIYRLIVNVNDNADEYKCSFKGKKVNEQEWVNSVKKIEKNCWFKKRKNVGVRLDKCILYQKVIYQSSEYYIQMVIVTEEKKFMADYQKIINKLSGFEPIIGKAFEALQLAIEKNRKIRQFALQSAIAAIMSRNLSHQRGSHLLPGLTSRINQFEDSIVSILTNTEEGEQCQD